MSVAADNKMLKSLEALSRSAMLRVMQEPETGLGLEADVERCLLSGIAVGDLAPVSEREFIQEFKIALQQPLNGWFKKLKKKVKKIAKKVAPGKLIGKVLKVTKKVAKKTLKVVKKVAPYAAAGAAIYFGAPYLMAGGSALYGAAKNMIGGAVSPAIAGGKSIAGTALKGAAVAKATQYATKLLAGKGVQMKSPESQAALQQYMAQETRQYMPPPPGVVQGRGGQYAPAPKTDLLKYALPAAALVGGALLLS